MLPSTSGGECDSGGWCLTCMYGAWDLNTRACPLPPAATSTASSDIILDLDGSGASSGDDGELACSRTGRCAVFNLNLDLGLLLFFGGGLFNRHDTWSCLVVYSSTPVLLGATQAPTRRVNINSVCPWRALGASLNSGHSCLGRVRDAFTMLFRHITWQLNPCRCRARAGHLRANTITIAGTHQRAG